MKSFKALLPLRHALAALALGCASLASAQELKIGAVNVDKVMQVSVAAKSAQSVCSRSSKKERDLELLTTQFKASVEKFEKDAPTFSETQRAPSRSSWPSRTASFQRVAAASSRRT